VRSQLGSSAAALSFAPVQAQEAGLAAKPLVVFVLGGPGAGKGTNCAKLVEHFGFVHLSAGDLLRAERQRGGPQADLINEYIKDGKIVPNEITCALIMDAMTASPVKKFLVDGYPRNLDNREGWEQTVGDGVELAGVLFFDCPEEALTERIIERGKTSGRDDDNAEAMIKRLVSERTCPVNPPSIPATHP
jgi:UMP-CMP kinase